MVIGDYNDELDDDTDDNVFQNFIDDSDNYLFADMSIATGNPQNFSFPNWPNHIDHILITNELFDEFNSDESRNYYHTNADNFIDGGFSSYDALITDHMPVGISLVLPMVTVNPLALNYNPDAVSDDGSCTYNTANENTVLFFSEFAEGSSNNKYLEIYNPTSSEVSPENYAMAIVVNTPAVGVYDSWYYFDIGSTVPAHSVFIVAHPLADASILSLADMTTTHLSNGDDGIALVYGNQPSINSSPSVGGYIVVDRIGDWDGDPGSGWSVAGVTNATKDHTLVRKCNISQGNEDWTASSGSTIENSADVASITK